MRKPNGSCTWRMSVDGMINIIKNETIRKHIISISNFTYRANRIYHALDVQVKTRDVFCGENYFGFLAIS